MADFQGKLNRIIDKLQENTGLIKIIPGSKAHQIAEAVAYEQFQTESVLEKDTIDNSPLLSSGKSLDNISEGFFGIPRRKAIRTEVTEAMRSLKFYVVNGTFGDVNNGNDIVIPAGTLLEGVLQGGVLVRLAVLEDTLLNKADSERFISCELVQGPTDAIPSGTITRHYFTNYAQNSVGTLLVTNIDVISTGRPDESDDNYRYRFINGLRSFAKTNTAGIFEVASDVPGVSYVIVDPYHNGGGTFAVYVQSVQSITPDSMLDEVRDAIEENVGPWIDYKVLKPNYVGLSLDISLTVRDPSKYIGNIGFASLIQNTISLYVNNFLGDTFYYNDIENVVMGITSDITDVTINSINKYVGNDTFRNSSVVDLTTDKSVVLSNIEKMIIEPVVNSIIVRVE